MGHFEKCKYAESCGYEFCPCEECIDFEAKVMTNADRIRSMTDEELAVFLSDDDRCCPPKHPNCKKYVNDCSGCFLEWLKQPAEVE